MRALVALSILAVAACGSPPDERRVGTDVPANSSPKRVPDGIAIAAVGDLIGEYRVAGIDDAEVPGREGIALSVDGPLMSFAPTCAGFVWKIGFEGERLSTSRHSDGGLSVAGVPAPVCAVAVTPAQRALARALDAATRAERTSSNGIRLSGGGHSATLFSQ